MTKIFCDKCGKEGEVKRFIFVTRLHDPMADFYGEVCEDCMLEIKAFVLPKNKLAEPKQ